MGNYVFSTNALLRMLHEDAHDKSSSHDFGKDVLPRRLESDRIFAYDFRDNRIPAEPGDGSNYWRDVGTVDAYFDANMEIRSANPPLNLYNRRWPLRTASYPDPPARFDIGVDGDARAGPPFADLRWLRHRRLRQGLGARPQRACPRRRGARGVHRPRQLRDRLRRARAPHHPRQERPCCRRRSGSASTPTATASATTSPRRASSSSPASARPSRSPRSAFERDQPLRGRSLERFAMSGAASTGSPWALKWK